MYKSARSRHPGGVNVIMADCSLRFVQDDIALATWRAMGTMNGGEVIRAVVETSEERRFMHMGRRTIHWFLFLALFGDRDRLLSGLEARRRLPAT